MDFGKRKLQFRFPGSLFLSLLASCNYTGTNMRMTNDDSYTNCLVAFHAVFRASSRGLKMQKRAHCDQLQVSNLSKFGFLTL